MADLGATPPPGTGTEPSGPEVLLDELRAQAPELARQAYDRFIREVPGALAWGPEERTTFLKQAEGRFGAILSVVQDGGIAPEALRGDLEAVGAEAANAGTELPHLKVTLRISRDLLLQSALRMTADRRHQYVVAAFIARLLPAIDGLTDALSDGYWNARLDSVATDLARLSHIIESARIGVYEADLDGIVRYANKAMAQLVGQAQGPVEGTSLSDVLRTVGDSPSVNALLAEPDGDVSQVTLKVGDEEDPQVLEINTAVRRVNDAVVGFGGLVRSPTATSVDTSALVPHIEELHRSLKIIIDAGTFLLRHGSQLTQVQVEQTGRSVRRQGKRLMLILKELNGERKNLS